MGSLTFPETANADREAALLTQHLLDNYDSVHGAGFMSCTVYDTAWLSLVKKENVDGQQRWLFPECFQYILDNQQNDGSWEAYQSEIDGILNTAASLLALQRHSVNPLQIDVLSPGELCRRVELARAALERKLSCWNVSETTHVGFEIIVPTLLRLLDEEGISFQFEGKATLMEINAAKMSRFKPEYLYGKTQLTALHSLEALSGMIDYTKVAHHKTGGGFMGSPSATAAYLIGLPPSKWDNEAEGYLRHVLQRSPGKDSVPSAFPSTNFEFSWVLSTLLHAGFTEKQLGPAAREVANVLNRVFETENGVVGFVPSIMADADDTAKTLSALNMMGFRKPATRMIEDFETETHFRTYPSERDSSFSANCNVLLALLHHPAPSQHTSQIKKVAGFLCNKWWNTDGAIKDKWNLSPLYPSMLMVQAFVELLHLVEGGRLPLSILDEEVGIKYAIAIYRSCVQAIQEQDDETGSWSDSVEITGYAVVLLSMAAQVMFVDPIRPELLNAVRRGCEYLQPKQSPSGDYLWIEKVTYGSPVLSQVYRLAALKLSSSIAPTSHIGRILNIPTSSPRAESFIKLYKATPLFSTTPEWKLRSAMAEGSLFLPLLKRRRDDVFTREAMTEDKYLEMIPFTWTACDLRAKSGASPSFLWEMMHISMLSYQGDEYMESVAAPAFAGDMDSLRHIVHNLIPGIANGIGHGGSYSDSEGTIQRVKDSTGRDAALKPLKCFVDFIMNHWAVVASSPADRASMSRELQGYLLAQIQQLEDNGQLAQAAKQPANLAFNVPFSLWVRTTSADHSSAPCYFAFVACLLTSIVAPPSNGNAGDCFQTVEQKYFAAAANRHLATMCRMYNDYGSVSRDAAESNLNSLDFPEFSACGAESPKASLFSLAQYERACLEDSLSRLEKECNRGSGGACQKATQMRRMTYWRLFCDVTDLYGQIYVIRDMSSNVKKAAAANM
ncbi:ent-kaurene synthase [Pyricularia oryzae 70-15]|uniref:Ent-kaurene synthase n=1 Tax=Pyricularia oryzae (strain 70-15 / ATCC MYA-4617 / FGSC 8958) TaxID=242507 RepID=G4NF17_PYRO7|nr:ent-kaurene synthase [Pyricularia oryzae 70-15]EHA49536.1 ent-kaurene synthase [Pyricularia oryzae 70-15]KAI7909719.1 ent-kaurene synthase [Pyricularia oryzae]